MVSVGMVQGEPSAGLCDPTTVACDLCGSSASEMIYPNTIARDLEASDFTVYGELNEYPRIVRCRMCALVYANPRDSLGALRDKYHRMPAEPYLEEQDARQAGFRSLLKVLQPYVPAGRVLDIGCSAGMFLAVLPEAYEGYGLEPSRMAATIAQRRFGERITVAEIEEAQFTPDLFDLITMWDVIEHVGSPLRVLEQVHQWIRLGGYLALMTPDFGSLTARLMGTRWHNLIRQHLFYFTDRTLTAALQATGFDVVRRSSWVRTHSLGYVLKRAHCRWMADAAPRPMAGAGIMGRLMGMTVPVPLFDDLFMIARKVSVSPRGVTVEEVSSRWH